MGAVQDAAAAPLLGGWEKVRERDLHESSRDRPVGCAKPERECRWAKRLGIVWVAGFSVAYVAAKAHTIRTYTEPHFLERHWPFWAAMLGWTALYGLAVLVMDHVMESHKPSDGP